MLTTLTEWEARCTETLAGIEAQIAEIRTRAKDDKLRITRREVEAEDAILQATEQHAKRTNGNRGDDQDDQRLAMNGGQSGGGGGGASMMGGFGNKIWGNMMGGRGGKRAAGGVGADEDEDIMDVDSDDVEAQGGLARRGAKRQGRSGLR